MLGGAIGHYRIEERLGEGGMGEVYLAMDTKLERQVALKFLPERLSSDPAARRRLLDEAKAASKLGHPNIVTIHSIEESGDRDFIVMEYVRGSTLGRWRGRMASADLLGLLIQLCGALSEAHGRDIIHRDIKPDNLMVDESGRLKIMDFGLASAASGDGPPGLTGAIVGSAPYMSPEQILGQPVDARSDIFSLGVVIFELATGQTPFSGEYDMAILYAIVNEPHPAPTDINPELPSGLERIIDRCLKKDPGERYQSCREIAADLQALQTEPARAPDDGFRVSLFSEEPSPAATRARLIGRAAECERITGRLDAARGGRGFTMVLSGESGVGKTRLAEEAVALARDTGMAVLRGRCLPHDGGFPYHAFTAAFRQGLPALDASLAEALVQRARAMDIELKDRIPILRSFLSPGAETPALLHREQLWDSLLLFLRTLTAERPMLLFLDDIQWADSESAGLFSFLARYAVSMPLLILGTMRESEGSDIPAALPDSLQSLRADGMADTISIGRLSSRETDALISSLLGGAAPGADVLAAVRGMTAGNPLFVAETVAYLRDTGRIREIDGAWRLAVADGSALLPERVREVISQRLKRLDERMRELLELAACEVEHFDSATLSACLKRDRIDVLRSLQTLETQHHLLRHEGARYRFDHPTIRGVLYDGMIPELREEYHRLIASHLTAGAEPRPEDASRIAYHLVSSGQKSAALPHLVSAAERARNLCANSEALNLYSQAAEIVAGRATGEAATALRILSGLGDSLLASGDVTGALRRYEDALQRLSADAAWEWRIDLTRKSAAPHRMLGNLKQALATAEAALAAAETHADQARRIECLNTLAFVQAARGEYAKTIELSRRAQSEAVATSNKHAESVALSHMGHAFFHTGEYREAVDSLDRAIALQRQIGDRRGLAQSLNFAGLAHHRLGRYATALKSHTESLETKRSIEESAAIPGSLNGLGDLYRDMGLWDRAIACHTESLALARRQGNRGAECDNLRDLGADYLLTGDHAAARRYLEEAQTLSHASGYLWYELRSLITLAWLDSVTGDRPSAKQRSIEGLSRTKEAGAREPAVEAHWVRAKVLLNSGETQPAIDELNSAIELATDADLGNVLWQMQWELHGACKRLGDDRRAQAALDDARRRVSAILTEIEDDALRREFAATSTVKQILEH
ncbi:MAG: protein kinase [Candidatus Zixiibacteriota bacterium]